MLDKNLIAKSLREASEKARSDTDTKGRGVGGLGLGRLGGGWRDGGWGGGGGWRDLLFPLPSSSLVKSNYVAVDPATMSSNLIKVWDAAYLQDQRQYFLLAIKIFRRKVN